MAPHLRVYFGPEDVSTPDVSSETPEIVVGDAKRTPGTKALPESGAAQPAAADIAIGLEELLQLIEDARRCGVALQDEVQDETVLVSRDLFRALLAYQTLLQPQASSHNA
ncbi:hypothetical protein LOC68_19690 [Blastopirellula sp. JC732]|uniref:Uncharacterized protein n=1 Tax=Blastopirellula sediminis TaxID=2894196 RepID=A0A9X1MNW4_9BACT|nr:hypothetical protein [Blastopirellula sediminis]MCC9606078.1 hypothetical protein [Blastopirellula sediminis]MCC9630623.1 hypothetical protein [Blastopirellula sediminis]